MEGAATNAALLQVRRRQRFWSGFQRRTIRKLITKSSGARLPPRLKTMPCTDPKNAPSQYIHRRV